MFVSRDELAWMLRRIYGQRISRDTLLRKFQSHGMTSLFPYYPGTDVLFDRLDDKTGVVKKLLPALEARINNNIDGFDSVAEKISYRDVAHHLLPIIEGSLRLEDSSVLAEGARVSLRPDSRSIHAKPGSEGFITEKSEGMSRVRFYAMTGRYGVDVFSADIPDDDLQVLTMASLLEGHQDLASLAEYLFHDAMLRSMRASFDASVYAFAADLAVQYLLDNGFLKRDGAELVGVLDRIFPALAPGFDQTYRNPGLFSSPTLSSPPSERKAHVLTLELTTGCDYNKCTFCSEYTHLTAETKSFAAFREHVDRVAESIGAEKSGIQRLFIGSGNSLGVDTERLLKCLHYARDVFDPQKITLYGRTASILEKSADELKRLREAGLTLVYWGLESGSDAVLNYICKGCTRADMIAAAKKLAGAGIEVSAMLMPGVGGVKYSEQHVAGTLELLHSIDIKYLTLLAINPAESCEYESRMRSETDNRHLTPDEVNAQVYKLLEGLEPSSVQIGMFTEEIDQASSNTKRFNCQFTAANKEFLLREFWN